MLSCDHHSCPQLDDSNSINKMALQVRTGQIVHEAGREGEREEGGGGGREEGRREGGREERGGEEEGRRKGGGSGGRDLACVHVSMAEGGTTVTMVTLWYAGHKLLKESIIFSYMK